MSTSTLPKSIQAAGGANQQSSGSSSSNNSNQLQDHRHHYLEFLERYKQLPDDFLRIPAYHSQGSRDYSAPESETARATLLAREAPLVDMIDISVVEAQLVKNYGLLRMDLYCKIRVGHMVCETQTCPNGAKNPKWDGVYQFSLKPGIDTFHLEIYDEKQFSLDEKIAWLCEPIPPEIFQGITVERWFPLSGRMGANKEGSVLLVLSHKRVPLRASSYARRGVAPPLVFVPTPSYPVTGSGPIITSNRQLPNAYIQAPPSPSQQLIQEPLVGATTQDTHQHVIQQHPAQQQQSPATPADINLLSEMFPSIDRAIIQAVLDNNHNDKEAAISALLALG